MERREKRLPKAVVIRTEVGIKMTGEELIAHHSADIQVENQQQRNVENVDSRIGNRSEH